MYTKKRSYKTVEFREVDKGDFFYKKGLKFKKIDSCKAVVETLFGKQLFVFKKDIKVIIKQEG